MPSSPETDGGAETLTESAEGGGGEELPRRDPEAELAQLDDRYKRALADLDNYRKRAAGEIDRRAQERSDAITRDWLEAVDSVERALRMGGPENELAAGLRAVLEQMEAILERQGLRRIGSPGERFDPALHEAVAVRETDEVPDHTIVEVARSGYGDGERVLRPAQVVVASASASAGASAEGEQRKEPEN
ncbi:MAG: molecular chaperone GrpE [Solirubrobacterales bacterium]|jgi:molecular chaperone GrpE|nr:molecular chaperone GrpE [Solirubrobacterales bacterium]